MTRNGEEAMRFRMADLPHTVADLISSVSSFFTLLPGDIVALGSPPNAQVEIFGNDTIEVDVPSIGSLRVTVNDPLFRHRSQVA
jgi:2-keto-4-pentenoate hydratase/2-oxohepta-3-ene-1,7-dioic acid hydratase in catechol pathway